MRFRIQGLGFRIKGFVILRFKLLDSRFRVYQGSAMPALRGADILLEFFALNVRV